MRIIELLVGFLKIHKYIDIHGQGTLLIHYRFGADINTRVTYGVKDPEIYQLARSNFSLFLWWGSFGMSVVGLHMDCGVRFFETFLLQCENVRLM